MDPPREIDDELFALPLRRQLFATLTALCRPATTQELAERLGRHHNTVRAQLGRLNAAGLVERRVVAQPRGRPRDLWAVAPEAAPGGEPPAAYVQLSRWLARAMADTGEVASIERTGRAIGRELAGEPQDGSVPDRVLDALAALGFAPALEARTPGGIRFVLRNCPYREAALQNPQAVCGLHRGITRGLLDRLARDARLSAFVPRDPRAAGCIVELDAGLSARAQSG
jgi:predicted ArsR family transcriptional regulator